MKKITKFSMGIGDRFAHQGKAQLAAFQQLEREHGVLVAPVWNKSNREHVTVGSQPPSVRQEADEAVAAAGWQHPYYVDADHINLKNVDPFIESADFFTLDVAEHIGETLCDSEIFGFIARNEELIGTHTISGLTEPLVLDRPTIAEYLRGSLFAVRQAGRLYRHIREVRGRDDFVTELSMDETELAQTPGMLLVILAAVAEEKIPIQTVAPKFTGRFNKGVDYVGSPEEFAREFNSDICILQEAVRRFKLPETLKLSVHSGSDKFSLYPHIAAALRKHDTGVHLKTAGTTWLEEVIGLAAAGGEALAIAKDIYCQALPRFDELCAPYATVLDVQAQRLPAPAEVRDWSGEAYVKALTHTADEERFNPDFRQFIHVAYKVAAEMGSRYCDVLTANTEVVGKHVTHNIYERHLKPLFA